MRNSASSWFSLSEYITMHGPMNVKFLDFDGLKLINVCRNMSQWIY